MCGIAGFAPNRSSSVPALQSIAWAMADTLLHRGPDKGGVWVDPLGRLALAHRRLAIVDLSDAGLQPMVSVSGRWFISFNGEIYNHLALRAELGNVAPKWRSHSDTETLLAAFEAWGIESTLKRCIGMFAFAAWDRQKRELTLARDRMGEKPLYYGWLGSGVTRVFAFASELKALRIHPSFESAVCRKAVAQYLRFCYVPAPRSIYKDIYKLEPGCLLVLRDSSNYEPPLNPLKPGDTYSSVELRRWWNMQTVVAEGDKAHFKTDYDGVAVLEVNLRRSLEDQVIADVPLGAFLSGGIDSSTIVALMQSQSTQPVKTFTIGFDEASFDELPHARAVADHLRTDHHEMRVSSKMAQDIIPLLPWMYDEPFADSSQIPTYLVSKAARQHVVVALSGDGGDELFGGYNRYLWGPYVWARLALVPLPVRKWVGSIAARVPERFWDSLETALTLNTSVTGASKLGGKINRIADKLKTVRNKYDVYRSAVCTWEDPASLLVAEDTQSVQGPNSCLDEMLYLDHFDDDKLQMMYEDSMTYLPDDILCKVDRAAMACGLETRVPFLDHRVVELSWRLPLNMKIRGNTGKWALRQVLYKYVPKELIERPKAGFAIPVGQWLRGPLRDWAESLLGETRLRQEGYFHPDPILKVWAEHLSGRRDHGQKIWTILMFQAWLEQQGK